MTLSTRSLATEFFSLAHLEGDPAEAARRYLHPDHIEHSPRIPGGAAGFVDAADLLRESFGPGDRRRILRVIADHDHVAIHSCVDTGVGEIRLDLYRIEDGRIAEHWDAVKPMADPTGIPHDNGETETVMVDTRSDAETNRRHGILFYDLAFVQKRFVEAADEFFGDDYVQHNSFVADGIEAFKDHFAGSATHRSTRYCQIPLRVVADDDHVLFQAHLRQNLADTSDRGIVIYDIFRFDQGRIVEHWDIATRIPDPADMAHTNGML